jgi:ADP-ribose pyrophosphatase YjhB (NUDIX family)
MDGVSEVEAVTHQPCAGGIVFDDAHRLLMVRRGHPPEPGRWSVPGGRCRPGESAPDACVREVYEETGVRVRVTRHAGRVERPGGAGVVYDIDDYVCAVEGGALAASDDASEVRWVDRAEFARLPLVSLLEQTLAGWDLLPR